MSLPEVMLVLREDNRREAQKSLIALQTQALSAFAVWDKESGRKLERLQKALGKDVQPTPEAAGTQDLESVFAGWGAQIQR